MHEKSPVYVTSRYATSHVYRTFCFIKASKYKSKYAVRPTYSLILASSKYSSRVNPLFAISGARSVPTYRMCQGS